MLHARQNEISIKDLTLRIGTPDAPILVDVCIDEDSALDPRLIPGAARHPFATIETRAEALKGRDVVNICQKGLQLNAGAAAILRAHGARARHLAGGIVAWTVAGLPAIPAHALPAKRVVAPERPDAQMLASLWLIRRFADRDTEVIFAPNEMRDAIADRYQATVAPGFGDTINQLSLNLPQLNLIEVALSGKSTEAASLIAVTNGLHRLCSEDDKLMTFALPLFDALYQAYTDGIDQPNQRGAA